MKKAVLFCENPYSFGILQPIAEVFKQRKTESFKLAFLGEYDHFAEYYQGVQEYHNDLIFLDAPSENHQTKHPVPFLENKIG